MKAFEKGQQKQQGPSTKSISASPSLDDLVPKDRLRKVRRGANLVPQRKSVEEADLSEKNSDQSNVLRWLQLLAAVGIPLVLVYLAFAGLVNPQFAELRELVSSNRDAIAVNASSIQRLEDKIDSSVERLDGKIDSGIQRLDGKIDSGIQRLEDRIDLIAEVLILATTNENITEAELRNLLNAGEE